MLEVFWAKFLPPTWILLIAVFNSFLAEFTLFEASVEAVLIASLFLDYFIYNTFSFALLIGSSIMLLGMFLSFLSDKKSLN